MKWVIDSTARFRWRPYYEQEELDNECEQIVSSFLKRRHGEIRFPISTDDLSVMIEQDTSDLDLYADLFCEGTEVEGLTDFFPDKKPGVKIARELSLDSWRLNRLRTTLAHEYGHVKFHAFLWDFGFSKKAAVNIGRQISLQRRRYIRLRTTLATKYDLVNYPSLSSSTGKISFFSAVGSEVGPRCKRSRILDAPNLDWMEWQASYICGALLMPLSLLRNIARSGIKEWDRDNWLPSDSEPARELIARVAEEFDVSPDAAQVRLLKLGFLQKMPGQDDFSSDRQLTHLSI